MLGRQAKVLSLAQVRSIERFLTSTRAPIRNRVILLLSLRAGLRAKEIADLTWSMVTDPEGEISDVLRLTDAAAKGSGGGVLPIASELRRALVLHRKESGYPSGSVRVVQTARRNATTPQVIVNLFADWYRQMGFEGCSSHSGRRTFITSAARNIGRFGGSLRDVQVLARHRSLEMTQRYIEIDSDAMRRVVEV